MSGIGSAALKAHRRGRLLTPLEAIQAKCAECCCDYADGRVDCGVQSCPLHNRMPYRDQEDGLQGRFSGR